MEQPIEHRRLAVYAHRQYGLFTLEQALRAGFSRMSVRRRVERGVWEAVEPRVFRSLPGARLQWRPALLARTLATRGVASFSGAGGLFELVPEGSLEVTVARSTGVHPGWWPTRPTRSRHRTSPSSMASRAPRRSGRCSTWARRCRVVASRTSLTPRSHAASFGPTSWRRAPSTCVPRVGAGAESCSRCSTTEMNSTGSRGVSGKHGCSACSATPGPGAGVQLRPRRRGPPSVPRLGVAEQKVALEFDGFAFHSSRRVFDDDRARQNDLVDVGWRVFRLTSTALTSDPPRAIAPIRRSRRDAVVRLVAGEQFDYLIGRRRGGTASAQ